MAPEHLETIFQEFSRIANPIQRHVRGTSLGLPLSRKLAGLLGGRLTVESAIDAGSTFTLELPLRPVSGVDDMGVRGKTILIIDDEEASRYISRHLFRESGYHVVESSNGTEGAERARFERPDLILLDLVMPERSGFEVLDDLKADEATRNIPVVINTSKTLSRNDQERLAGRHAAVLPKAGARRREALRSIRQILDDSTLFQKEPEFAGSDKDRV